MKEIMHTKIRSLLLTGVTLLVPISTVHGESLWARRTPEHAFLFHDAKARAAGDLLTILISQDTALDHKEDRGMSKSSSLSSVLDLAGKMGGGFGAHEADAALDASNSAGRKFNGAESFRSEQALTDRVTVTVMQVLPNGNLVVSGHRMIQVAGEQRELVLCGTVRSVDIGPDNSISSRDVADLEITYESAGTGQTFTRQGWLGRRMNRVWPF